MSPQMSSEYGVLWPTSGLDLLGSLCLFCVVVHTCWLMNVCFCCVRFCFSIPILCWVGRKTLTPINQWIPTYRLHQEPGGRRKKDESGPWLGSMLCFLFSTLTLTPNQQCWSTESKWIVNRSKVYLTNAVLCFYLYRWKSIWRKDWSW